MGLNKGGSNSRRKPKPWEISIYKPAPKTASSVVYNALWGDDYEDKTADLPTLTTTDPIIAYRIWSLTADKRLKSVARESIWPLRKPMVQDDIQNLGIHAIKNGAAIPQLAQDYDLLKDQKIVAGSVYLWGRVVEKERGYLAQYAYPKEIWVDEATDPLTIMELEHGYGVGVVMRSELNRRVQFGWTAFPNFYFHPLNYYSQIQSIAAQAQWAKSLQLRFSAQKMAGTSNDPAPTKQPGEHADIPGSSQLWRPYGL
jgi:hypothetical protein